MAGIGIGIWSGGLRRSLWRLGHKARRRMTPALCGRADSAGRSKERRANGGAIGAGRLRSVSIISL